MEEFTLKSCLPFFWLDFEEQFDTTTFAVGNISPCRMGNFFFIFLVRGLMSLAARVAAQPLVVSRSVICLHVVRGILSGGAPGADMRPLAMQKLDCIKTYCSAIIALL